MDIIVPMAGLGSRFARAGYEIPKPLIPVSGLPMVVRAIHDLPVADRVILIVHPEHVRDFDIDRVLHRFLPTAEIVVTPGLTQGQACTVGLAREKFPVDTDVLIAACDNTHVYDPQKLQHLQEHGDVESLIWTYRHDCRVLSDPCSYGWVDVADESGEVTRVFCKQPISSTHLDDHAVSGTFWFRSAHRLFRAIDHLVAGGQRVNNEFYLDVVPNVLLEQRYRVLAFEVDRYIGWGTPEDLQEFQSWERYFGRSSRKQNAA